MIKSMTAYAKAEVNEKELEIGVEIRSYNSRFLDCNLKVPHGYSRLEEKIKTLIGRRVSRGRVEVKLQVRDESEEGCAFQINEPRARAYVDALMTLKDKFGLENSPTLELMTAAGGMIVPVDMEIDMDRHWGVIEKCFSIALDDLNNMRQTEGDYLKKDFFSRLDYIESVVKTIEAESDGLLDIYRNRLKERVEALANGLVEIDEGRIAQEAVLLADRSDISEEITRAKSHIAQFRAIIDAEEPGGRKLNFLLQELNREFNTMGAKTGKAMVSHLIVTVKSELEKLREQVQNVE